jgi:preprotein translocase subunit SecB
MLPPINFDALFANAVQQAAEEANSAESGEGETKH